MELKIFPWTAAGSKLPIGQGFLEKDGWVLAPAPLKY